MTDEPLGRDDLEGVPVQDQYREETAAREMKPLHGRVRETTAPEEWANWALMGNDALYPHQIPDTLKELHRRIAQAVSMAVADARKGKADAN